MQIKLSNTLQRHLNIGCHEAHHRGDIELSAEIAFISILRERLSHATHILRQLLQEWEQMQIRTRVERELDTMRPKKEHHSDALTIEQKQAYLSEQIQKVYLHTEHNSNQYSAIATTAHFMIWLLRSRKYRSSQAMEFYGVSESKIVELLRQMPANEDYYMEMQALDMAAKQSDTEMGQFMELQSDELFSSISSNGMGLDFGTHSSISQTTATKIEDKSESILSQYGVNLSELAHRGEIDPVIGRESEIERISQILGRRKKNNPILIGEAGVGKSAIVEGLALRIMEGNTPSALIGKEIFSLNIASLVADTKYRGEFEQRMNDFIEVLGRDKNIILFIDELHTIMGAGSTSGSLDVANILKPVLARGDLQCIGATTLDEYRESIESNSALERRFQKIVVKPTTKEQTLDILQNIKQEYEQHHLVKYTDRALLSIVQLSEQYLPQRNFPDKAIDVLDEAGSKARQLRENGESKRIKADDKSNRKISHSIVTIDSKEIEEVVSLMSGVPVTNPNESDFKKLRDMEKHLSTRVIGQKGAIGKIVSSIHRSRTGLKDPNKPIGVFMFVGPTGVGKTHLAKELSSWMFGREDAIIRVDMSEYAEKHNVSRMLGSPPGYVGYNEGGQLSEAVRRQPYSVVLLDEIEKAHPDVFNIMLQVFDEGRLIDGAGRSIDFRNTVIIMTSNVGSVEISQRPAKMGFTTAKSSDKFSQGDTNESEYKNALERTFTPEFLNRVDEIVIFNSLNLKNIRQIVTLELKRLTKRVEAIGYKLSIAQSVYQKLAELGYQPRYGARSLQRTIMERVEEPLAELIVSGEITEGDSVEIRLRQSNIEFTRHSLSTKVSTNAKGRSLPTKVSTPAEAQPPY